MRWILAALIVGLGASPGEAKIFAAKFETASQMMFACADLLLQKPTTAATACELAMMPSPSRDKIIMGNDTACFPASKPMEARAFAYHSYVARMMQDRRGDMDVEWVAYAGKAWAAAFPCQ